MRKILIFSFSLTLLLLLSAGTVAAGSTKYVEGEIIVKLKHNSPNIELDSGGVVKTGIVSIDALSSKYKVQSMDKVLKKHQKASKKPRKNSGRKHNLDKLYLLKMPEYTDIYEAVEMFNKDINIEYAEPNYRVNIDLTPNDPDYSKLWGLHNIGQTGGAFDADIDAPEAWGLQTGDNNVVIAVIDTGVDYGHEDLLANMWVNQGEIPGNNIDDDGNGFIDDVKGWDFSNNDNDPFDDYGHGTHCAGTIGAVSDNNIGIVGINWNVRILPIKFLNSSGSGSTADAVSSINYATLMGADVMSNSWGGGGFSQALKDAISAANDAGILFIAAAGNSGSNNDISPHYPSSYDVPNVVAVAATDHNDQKAGFSCYGVESVDLGAPGVNIYSTVPTGLCSLCATSGYTYLSGTSMATPHIAGAAGLIKSQFPGLTSDDIKARLLNSVDLIPSLEGITVTGGRLNAYNSLEVDDVSPSAVADLAVSSSAFNSITLNWTATGDDGSVGTASCYDVRYSIIPITSANWGMADQASGEPSPQAPGSVETFAMTGLSYDTTYYFALKVIDNVGNFSELSNIISGTTKMPVIVFEDNMEDGINGWTHSGVNDNWGLGAPTSGPGYAYSGSNVWATNLIGDYGSDNMDIRLSSPSIDLTGIESTQLMFQHYYYTESYYDGAIVEILDNEGIAWTQITPVSGYPEDALYSGNPLGPVPAYSGYSGGGWHQAVFDISDYDGSDNIKIRFRFGTDYSVNYYPGWYIDDVAIIGESVGLQPPVANAGPDQEASDADGDNMENIILDGSASYDPDGSIASYIWEEEDVVLSEEMTFTHSFSTGQHTIILTVTDNDGLASNDDVLVTVNPNQPPVANAGSDQTVFVDEIIAFDGSASGDIDGTIAAYDWDFGDGSAGSGANATYAYTTPGIYEVVLTVTDNGGDMDSDIMIVTVEEETTTEVVITKHNIKSRWDRKKNRGKVEVQINFTVIQGSINQLVLKEITDETGDWRLEKSKAAVKINTAKYVWSLTLDDDNNAVIDFGANGIVLNTGDVIQVSKIKFLNDQRGGYSLICQISAGGTDLAIDTVPFDL